MPLPFRIPWSELLAKSWFPPVCLALTAAVFLLPGTASIPLMDRDEPRFAQATWEMMERGEWFIPYFNDAYRFDKPVLSYWWMRLHYNLFGKTEFSARLHSVVSAFLTSLVIFHIGRRFFSRQTGFLAAFAWLTCVQVLIHGRLCVADMPMLLGVTLSMYGVLSLLSEPEAPPRFGPWFWALAAGLVVGFLAKGPLALFVPLLGLLLARFVFYRQPLPWMRLQPVTLALLVLAGVGLWGIPALLQTQGAFWKVGIGEHVVKRGTQAFNGRITVPVIYYLFTAILSLLPWSAFLPSAFRNPGGWNRWPLVPAILLGWFIAPFLVFGLYATQLPHYILPGFPAFFLLLFRSGTASLRDFPRWFWSVSLPILVLSSAFLLFVSTLPLSGELEGIKRLLLLGGLLFVVLFVFAFFLRREHWRGIPLVAISCALLLTLFGSTLRDLSLLPKITAAWQHRSREGAQNLSWFFQEPSLVFYTGKTWRWRKWEKELPDASQWLREKENRGGIFLLREWRLDDQFQSLLRGQGYVSAPSLDFTEMVRRHLPDDEFEFQIVRGLNVARSSWVELLLCLPKRPGP